MDSEICPDQPKLFPILDLPLVFANETIKQHPDTHRSYNLRLKFECTTRKIDLPLITVEINNDTYLDVDYYRSLNSENKRAFDRWCYCRGEYIYPILPNCGHKTCAVIEEHLAVDGYWNLIKRNLNVSMNPTPKRKIKEVLDATTVSAKKKAPSREITELFICKDVVKSSKIAHFELLEESVSSYFVKLTICSNFPLKNELQVLVLESNVCAVNETGDVVGFEITSDMFESEYKEYTPVSIFNNKLKVLKNVVVPSFRDYCNMPNAPYTAMIYLKKSMFRICDFQDLNLKYVGVTVCNFRDSIFPPRQHTELLVTSLIKATGAAPMEASFHDDFGIAVENLDMMFEPSLIGTLEAEPCMLFNTTHDFKSWLHFNQSSKFIDGFEPNLDNIDNNITYNDFDEVFYLSSCITVTKQFIIDFICTFFEEYCKIRCTSLKSKEHQLRKLVDQYMNDSSIPEDQLKELFKVQLTSYAQSKGVVIVFGDKITLSNLSSDLNDCIETIKQNSDFSSCFCDLAYRKFLKYKESLARFEDKRSLQNFLHSQFTTLSSDTCKQSKNLYEQLYKTMRRDRVFWFVLPNHDISNILDEISRMNKINFKKPTLSIRVSTLKQKFELSQECLLNNCPSLASVQKYNSLLPIPVLLKPNGVDGFICNTFINLLEGSTVSRLIRIEFVPTISQELFNALYPNCMDRPYGEEWHRYLSSGPVAMLWFESWVSNLREICIETRRLSGLVWTKNVLHCPETDEEAFKNLNDFDLETQKNKFTSLF